MVFSFKATCLIGEEEIATEYALNKKDAKKAAAEAAIRLAAPQPVVSLKNGKFTISMFCLFEKMIYLNQQKLYTL